MKKFQIWANLILIAFFGGMFILQTPNLNPMYADGAFTWCFVITVFAVVNVLLSLGGIKTYQDSYGRMQLQFDKQARGFKVCLVLIITIWGLYAVVSIFSSPLFNYKAYRDQLGTTVPSEFSSDIQPMDMQNLPIVDKLLAYELADKKLGENASMGSQVTLGTPVIQQIKGKLMWAVPLEHSGFFKWLKNINGSAGYILVSATNMKDVTFVGDHKIKYQSSAYFFDDLQRHTRFAGSAFFNAITDYSFEVNDEGIPFWIITTYKNRWLFSLPEANGIILVNAETGKISKHTLDNIPAWVDRVQPEAFIMQQIVNNGEYVHGIFNFSNQDKFQSSQGNIIVYNNNHCYLFTGLTSVGSDESAIGFIMVDMVTKEYKVYKISGATEYAAQLSAEGKVQQYGYKASFPMIINFDGEPTYFMPLKDNSGLIKQYAFVPVSQVSSVGVGETVNDAVRNFRQVLRDGGVDINTGGESKTLSGTIERIASEATGTNLIYKLIISEQKDIIFTAAYDLSEELALTLVGDKVEIVYSDTGESTSPVTKFDNLGILTRETGVK